MHSCWKSPLLLMKILTCAFLGSLSWSFQIHEQPRYPRRRNPACFHHIHSSLSALAVQSGSSNASSSDWRDETFTEETRDLIAREVQKHVTLSIEIPSPIIDFVLSQVIDLLVTSELSADVLLQLRAVLEAESTFTEFDDVMNLGELAHSIAVELNGKMDAPLLDERQELDILEGMVNVILTVLTTSEAEEKELRIQSSLNATRSLLQSDESRIKIAQMINDAVDMPLLGEHDEQALLLSAIGTCADVLQQLLPPELLGTIRGKQTTAAGLAEMKRHLVTRLCSLVDLSMFLSLEQEEAIIQKFVDVAMNELLGNTEAEFLLMNRFERRSMLVARRRGLLQELEISRGVYEREQRNLQARLEAIEEKLRD